MFNNRMNPWSSRKSTTTPPIMTAKTARPYSFDSYDGKRIFGENITGKVVVYT